MMESMHSEDQARRAAKRVGLQAWKSRWRKRLTIAAGFKSAIPCET
jgi:hypothetical protein